MEGILPSDGAKLLRFAPQFAAVPLVKSYDFV